MRSRTYVFTLPDADRAALLERVAALAGTHPHLAGRATFKLPYGTQVFRAKRVG